MGSGQKEHKDLISSDLGDILAYALRFANIKDCPMLLVAE
jgi:hypothetical protein